VERGLALRGQACAERGQARPRESGVLRERRVLREVWRVPREVWRVLERGLACAERVHVPRDNHASAERGLGAKRERVSREGSGVLREVWRWRERSAERSAALRGLMR
jgi:hypothetical protein